MSEENKNNENGNQEVTFTDEQQAKVDEIVAARLAAQKKKADDEVAKLKAGFDKKLQDELAKAKMTADELKTHELEEKQAELESLRAEKKQREHSDEIKKLFADSGISAKISPELFNHYEDTNAAKQAMADFKKTFDDAVLEEVNKRISSHTPKQTPSGGNGNANPFLQESKTKFSFNK